MSDAFLLGSAFVLLLLGALVSLAAAPRRRVSGWVSVGFVTVAAVAAWAVAIRTFAWGPEPEVTLLTLPGLRAALSVHVDYLSALFLAVAATVAFLTTLYSVEYMDRYPRDSVAKYYPVLLVLFVGIGGVVAVTDFLFFLVFWELMTVASFFLVIYERENPVSQRAGLKCFVYNQAAALGMVAGGLILWRHAGSFHFDDLRVALGALLVEQPTLAHFVLLLFFLGFATKAGILPMGSWLPDAYPAAPSGATAAFGGAMTKLGVYGVLRIFLHVLPLSSATTVWGFIIALAGMGSLFVGTVMALRQDDVKRLMSFHVIGQVGYMFFGVGIGLALLVTQPVLGMLALLGGVFHMVNHSLYKSCLFFGAGAVEHRTGSRSLAALGGLGSFMAATAACATVASLAIAGVPPLNGFASKWLMYASAVLGGRVYPLLAVAGVVAMFISLVTLASFLKYLGGTFLGLPAEGAAVKETPATMLGPQVFLALVCVGFGLLPLFPLTYVHLAVSGLPSAAGLPSLSVLLGRGPGLEIAPAGVGLAFWGPLPAAFALLVLGGLAYWWLQRVGGAEVRKVPIWTCGEELRPSAVRYPASSFYLPFKEALRGVYPAIRPGVLTFPPSLRRALDIDRWLYMPVARVVERAAHAAGRTHPGVAQIYLTWIVVGAVVVVAILLLTVR